ncbi:sigma-E factor regulatory protein RseB [Vibrio mangrovi]|uniref:Sigma-E factor regulatory protein RseB n=1 Tax=Vibrio mangrovi TaxID=474394 RepID=A0A1Y6IWI3_9VIBR|nr:sigma-E factor regulatory protein RseB [Vibrio mangrovi]MDW6002949.1 sigma-E factor regulatory protein RseB [Vibrio mangrovi]SMS01190.1 Sigma-E factor regulatory protein RseB precursor [Vibrio mangrovi]
MKKFLVSVVTALFSVNISLAFADDTSAEALLHQMSRASQKLNYELSYILIKKNGIEPLLYRHAVEDGYSLAHLIYLSGPVREVIRRGDEVSYIEPGVEPFTIESGKMVAPVIPLLHSDMTQLSNYYDFVKIGRGREAGAACQVIRVVPKDGLRYSYVLWIDERSNLPLRADLVDRDGEVLEQYRTISYSLSDKLAELMLNLNKAQLPQVLSLPENPVKKTFWDVGWVPDGFTSKELNRYRMAITNRLVESQIYTDGLFSFSVYVADSDNHSLKNQLIRQGRRTLQTLVKGKNEISVIGDIPPATAKRIAQSVTFESHSNVTTEDKQP